MIEVITILGFIAAVYVIIILAVILAVWRAAGEQARPVYERYDPARHEFPRDVSACLEAARVTGAANRKLRVFAVVQIAASFVLVASAGATIKTLLSLEAAQTGFDTHHVLTVNVPVMHEGKNSAQVVDYYREATRRIRELPGVQNAAVGGIVPQFERHALLGSDNGSWFVAETDESDGTLIEFHPEYSIVLNIDEEHLDYYANWAKADPRNAEARSEGQVAAWLSYLLPGAAARGLSHTLGKRIGSTHDIPHGVTSCLLLPHAIRFLAPKMPGRVAILSEVMGGDAADCVQGLIASLDLPQHIASFGVGEPELRRAAAELAGRYPADDLLRTYLAAL